MEKEVKLHLTESLKTDKLNRIFILILQNNEKLPEFNSTCDGDVSAECKSAIEEAIKAVDRFWDDTFDDIKVNKL